MIGTTAALLGSAVIGAAGSALTASAASKANNKSIAAQQAATDQATALQQQQYDRAAAAQAPYQQAGYAGLDALLAQFGLGGGTSAAGGAFDPNAYLAANPDVAQYANDAVKYGIYKTPQEAAQAHFDQYHTTESRPGTPQAQPQAQQPAAPAPNVPQATPTTVQGPREAAAPRETYTRPDYVTADTSLGAFQASPDYQFRLNEGSRNLNAFNASKGILGSGAAAKALVDYGQNTADAEYGDFYNRRTSEAAALNAQNQNAFAADRQYGTGVYDADRTYSTDLYNTDRTYNASQASDYTANLFKIAGVGTAANSAVQNAGSSYANNGGTIAQTNANNLSSAYGQQAQNTGSLVGSLTGAANSVANAYAKPATPYIYSNPATPYYSNNLPYS